MRLEAGSASVLWRRIPRRLRRAAVLSVVLVIAVLLLHQHVGSKEALRIARSFVSSSPEIRRRIGSVSDVRTVGRTTFSSGFGAPLASFQLEAKGEAGSVRTQVYLKRDPSGEWQIYSAVLLAEGGPIPLKAAR